ncbi:MAG: hypothetical protein VW268_03000 [Rhodospirillaceae bacterium]
MRTLKAWQKISAGLAVVLLAGAGALWAAQLLLAEKAALRVLGGLGVTQAKLSISDLTPSRAAANDLEIGAGGKRVRLKRLTLDLSWPAFMKPRVVEVGLLGLGLTVDISGGAVDAGLLTPLLGAGGKPEAAGGSPPADKFVLSDATIRVLTPQGPVMVRLDRAEIGSDTDGAIAVPVLKAVAEHALGSAGISAVLALIAALDLDAKIDIADGRAEAAGIRAEGLSGNLALAGPVRSDRHRHRQQLRAAGRSARVRRAGAQRGAGHQGCRAGRNGQVACGATSAGFGRPCLGDG